MKNIIGDNLQLLKNIMFDEKKQSSLYKPGRYWRNKTLNSIKTIEREGLSDFRSGENHIGLGYTDILYTDIRNSLRYGIRGLTSKITKMYPINKIYQAQLDWTKYYASENVANLEEALRLNPKIHKLIEDFKIPYSLLGGCKRVACINGKQYSTHYLNLLDQHNQMQKHIDFFKVTSLLEIGGGYGANIHILLENYPNIKKVLYLDIAPNLYVGTQYLKAFYGDSVVDYNQSRVLDEITFQKNSKLEIICVTPWQLEKISTKIDLFINSNSFVEMPECVVGNYVEHIFRISNKDDIAIALSTYDDYDSSTTILPEDLPRFFLEKEFIKFREKNNVHIRRNNLYYICPGKLSYQ